MSDDAREQLRADVALMRELGVLRWGEIVLGPSPLPASAPREVVSPEEQAKRKAAEAKRVLFAASGYVPKDDL